MGDNLFQLVGKVDVPAEKKNKMNKQVLKILDKCGIRKTMEMTVAGRKIIVVSPARPNADGIVLFDYSIFEKRKRNVSTYDLNTCELHAEDRGYDEFGIVMNMIMVLQEAYTDGGCYFAKSGEPYDIEIYLLLLQGVLRERITPPERFRDIMQKNCPGDTELCFWKISFYKSIQRKDEDEFLEFWDGGNLTLSQDMKDCIRRWEEKFNSISVPSDISTEHFLVEIIIRLESSYCRYVDEVFVAEFIEHGDDSDYQRALILLEQLLDKGQEYFPELTGEQADEWIIRGARDRFDRIAMSALPSLLTNKEQRYIRFGF